MALGLLPFSPEQRRRAPAAGPAASECRAIAGSSGRTRRAAIRGSAPGIARRCAPRPPAGTPRTPGQGAVRPDDARDLIGHEDRHHRQPLRIERQPQDGDGRVIRRRRRSGGLCAGRSGRQGCGCGASAHAAFFPPSGPGAEAAVSPLWPLQRAMPPAAGECGWIASPPGLPGRAATRSGFLSIDPPTEAADRL